MNHYCRICSVLLSHLESFSGFCVTHNPDPQQPPKPPSDDYSTRLYPDMNWMTRCNELKKEVERLKECLEPGKASAICNGLFSEAERLGFYKPTGKHALTQFVEEVELLRKQRDALLENSKALSAVLTELRAACRMEPAMNHHKYDGLGVLVNEKLTIHTKLMEQIEK